MEGGEPGAFLLAQQRQAKCAANVILRSMSENHTSRVKAQEDKVERSAKNRGNHQGRSRSARRESTGWVAHLHKYLWAAEERLPASIIDDIFNPEA